MERVEKDPILGSTLAPRVSERAVHRVFFIIAIKRPEKDKKRKEKGKERKEREKIKEKSRNHATKRLLPLSAQASKKVKTL